MRKVHTITGTAIQTDCIGCSIASSALADYPGTIYRGEHFHAHQDIEISLPGFVIISTLRHIVSITDFSPGEQNEFSWLLPAIRNAQRSCGFKNVYLFQNEDTVDHFHIWLFPIYEWMMPLGRGPVLLNRAIEELKSGRYIPDKERLFEMIALLRENLGSHHG
jgi:diadenosine tetraphosphate (Ap4A) HIT family hydrolase